MSLTSTEEKVAFLLKSLPVDKAEALLTRLGAEKGNRLRVQMKRLENEPVPQEGLSQLLKDFEDLLKPAARGSAGLSIYRGEADGSAATGQGPAKEQKANPVPSKSNETVAAGTTAPARRGSDPFAPLRSVDLNRLALAVKGEQPRVVALVLDHLDPPQAGELFKRLSPEQRREVSVQLGRPLAAGADLLQRIAQAVLVKSQNVEEAAPAPAVDDKFKRTADMLRLLNKADRADLLEVLDQKDPETSARVKEFLYQFEDLLAIEDRSMQKLLSEIDSKTLALALKGASQPISERVLSNLSKRARESLQEEMEFLGSASPEQIQQAQKSVVELIQRLDQAGELVMK
jgi:flagellar motor switch protein FliG